LGAGDVVLTHITSSTTTSYSDNTVIAGNHYYYRVYAYRYTTDNINGNSYDLARGRAYQVTNFVSVDYIIPLPIADLFFFASPYEGKVKLEWFTTSKHQVRHYSVERTDGDAGFSEIGRIVDLDNSQYAHYYLLDAKPFVGDNYYRLKETDYMGDENYSEVRLVSFLDDGDGDLVVFSMSDGNAYFSYPCSRNGVQWEIVDINGRILYMETTICSEGSFTKQISSA
jgi:hypothetical protein